MIREVGRGQDHFVPGIDHGHQRQREAVVGAGRDDEIFWPHGGTDDDGEAFGEGGAK
jgi:hypothetical protein